MAPGVMVTAAIAVASVLNVLTAEAGTSHHNLSAPDVVPCGCSLSSDALQAANPRHRRWHRSHLHRLYSRISCGIWAWKDGGESDILDRSETMQRLAHECSSWFGSWPGMHQCSERLDRLTKSAPIDEDG